MKNRQRNTGGFKAEVVKALLFNVSVTTEFSDRFGLSAAEIRRLLYHTIDHVDDIFSENVAHHPAPMMHTRHNIVNESELHLLLDSYDHYI